VNFSHALRVVLIPSKEEYRSAGLNSSLWWDSSDFSGFQQTAHSEILLFSKFEKIDIKSARKKLYQPNQCDDAKLDLIFNACSPQKKAPQIEVNDEDSDETELKFPCSPHTNLRKSESNQSKHFIDDALSLCVPLLHHSQTVSFDKPKLQKFVAPEDPSLSSQLAVVMSTFVLSIIVLTCC